MNLSTSGEEAELIPEFLSGGGEMGQRIREFDWSSTSLGPVNAWPQSLRTCIRIMLGSRQPIWIGWGKDLIKLYNDPYRDIVRGKHPWALGKPAAVVWREIWPTIGPMLHQVMEKDEGTYVESQFLAMERNGYPEETYYTFSYTPIPGANGGTAGMICFNTDDTERIISERQLNTLTSLGKRLTDSQSAPDVIRKTVDTLRENPFDFPIAGFYLVKGDKACLTASTEQPGTTEFTEGGNTGKSAHGTDPPLGSRLPAEIDLNGRYGISAAVKQALQKKQPQIVDDAADYLGRLQGGPWELPPSNIMILPFTQTGEADPYGLLVTGLNPYRLPDEKYRGFFSIIADQVTSSFGNVHVLEQERKRAQALAEIDLAKTTFFSNISHEFRTPLTLLLGPIEDALRDPDDVTQNRLRMGVAYRNALRMQKLVNALLEFSRIEAGRLEGQFSRVDVCALTADLVSSFRSAIEKAGMSLKLDLEPVTAEVYVDPAMFEKIILNLVSNAFKYTSEGEIGVAVRERNGEVRISVTDTGIGIPEDQLHRIFDRFHRVENATVRTQEGTGIGLALVKELVRIHEGRIEVESNPGQGSTFTVVLPSGKNHLAPDRIISPESIPLTRERNIYVEES
ncbi:MAG TPA: GAF domain-containing sensor histidine kinase, partial [Puia sp.]|nr:GAF domain-containing sensor histidine kinase [Puia sp.]